MSDIARIIGQRIRNYRVKLGLSQEKLAELSGIPLHHRNDCTQKASPDALRLSVSLNSGLSPYDFVLQSPVNRTGQRYLVYLFLKDQVHDPEWKV